MTSRPPADPAYVLEHQPSGGFVIYVPGTPGLATEGATREQATAMLRDAFPAYLESMRAHGLPHRSA
jgi:predicted RNase H-like HicB family nuclease